MSPEWWSGAIGTVAAVCTTVAFVPQIVKTWRQGGRDLSYGMLLLYLAGLLLWLIYGVSIEARVVIVANGVALALVSLNLGLKWLRESRPRTTPPARRNRIAIDMDEVLADSLAKHLRVYNETFGAALEVADLYGRELEAAVPESRAAALRELILDPSFFRDLDVIEGGGEVLRELAERYEVFVASAAMEVPTSFAAKHAWLRERFPFIAPSHIVFCGDKAVLDVDYLIDDTPRHFERFQGTPILFDAPHNRHETRFLRATGWADVRRMFLEDPPSLRVARLAGEERERATAAPELG
jgi:5'(3')-deoxyribonucleotidase/uncharacterized protein with PQ loop repeat